MSKQKDKFWMLCDARYRFDKSRYTHYEVCDSLKEAKRNKSNYGNDTLIVECETEGSYITKSTILN